MGTQWSVQLADDGRRDLHALHACVTARLDRVVAQMSTWLPTSDLCRFNRAAAGDVVTLPEEFSEVLACGLEIAAASDGAFDPGIGALVGLWGFGAEAATRTPTGAECASARARSGWRRIDFDRDQRRLRQPGGLQLDLSAIAKGHAVDLVVQALRGEGICAALVDVGGELFGYGRKPDGSRWRVLVEAGPDEDDDSLPPCLLALDGCAVASSGDRWHHYLRDGRRYTHTLDPRSGQPLPHAPAAVSVIASSAMRADAWATALGVLGPDAGLALAADHGLGARFVQRQGVGLVERMNDAFRARLAA